MDNEKLIAVAREVEPAAKELYKKLKDNGINDATLYQTAFGRGIEICIDQDHVISIGDNSAVKITTSYPLHN